MRVYSQEGTEETEGFKSLLRNLGACGMSMLFKTLMKMHALTETTQHHQP